MSLPKPSLTGLRLLAITLCISSLPLTGCSLVKGSPPPIRYYLIDEVTGDQLRDSTAPLALEIRDLFVPQYLDRFHMVQRIGQGELYVAEGHQWGENLRKNLMRVLAGNLSQRLATVDIGTPIVPSVSKPDFRLILTINRFEHDTDGKVRLSARWQLTNQSSSNTVVTRQAELVSQDSFEADNYSGGVQAMSAVFAELSDRLAESVIAAQAGWQLQ